MDSGVCVAGEEVARWDAGVVGEVVALTDSDACTAGDETARVGAGLAAKVSREAGFKFRHQTQRSDGGPD